MKRPELRAAGWVVVLALVAGGCNFFKKAQGPDDNAVTSDIQAKLFQDPVLKTRDIQVNTQSGVVTLSGTVNTDLEKAAVERLANQETGVKQVIDQLAVAQAAPAAAPASEQAARTEAAPRAAKPRRKHHATEMASNTPPAAAPPAEPAQNPSPTPAPVVEQSPQPAAPPAPPPPVTVTIPAGTAVRVQMIDSVDSATNQPGQEFAATVDSPVVVGSQVVIPASSDAKVRLVNATTSGRIEGSAGLALELVSISVNGTPYSVQSGMFQQSGSSRGRRTAEATGAGAVLGGLIGAIAGRGKGAAIGAGAGGATGAGVSAAGKRGDVKVPSETKIDFTLKAPLNVTLSQ